MKKLRLNHDDLRVESFGTEPVPPEGGTVVAHSGQATCYNTGCQSGLSSICQSEGVTDCPGYDTCDPASYDGGFTCYASCTNVEACSFCGAMC